jgi:hypothetical protein
MEKMYIIPDVTDNPQENYNILVKAYNLVKDKIVNKKIILSDSDRFTILLLPSIYALTDSYQEILNLSENFIDIISVSNNPITTIIKSDLEGVNPINSKNSNHLLEGITIKSSANNFFDNCENFSHKKIILDKVLGYNNCKNFSLISINVQSKTLINSFNNIENGTIIDFKSISNLIENIFNNSQDSSLSKFNLSSNRIVSSFNKLKSSSIIDFKTHSKNDCEIMDDIDNCSLSFISITSGSNLKIIGYNNFLNSKIENFSIFGEKRLVGFGGINLENSIIKNGNINSLHSECFGNKLSDGTIINVECDCFINGEFKGIIERSTFTNYGVVPIVKNNVSGKIYFSRLQNNSEIIIDSEKESKLLSGYNILSGKISENIKII